ncbi:Uncharacterized protein SCG7109_BO_00020 [Chlamydiales bacterium SCGC AG-110-M15]|nr:Uncharacterized protein SCG7109_BO_00020 [Chlamydiales bacterium SCGC AG-110-M15]
MVQALFIHEMERFVGRTRELKKLHDIDEESEPSIVIVYGRRRVGKTELLEQAFRDRNILKFEGIEGLSEAEQFANAMRQLANYVQDDLLNKVNIKSWSEFFDIVAKYTKEGRWTIYLEELQWLANYEDKLISELKYAWDNLFRRNSEIILVLCGSAPSFMLDKVVHSKALYNRSQHEIHLQELNILDTKSFLKKRSDREIFNAYLTVGGVPEYLKWLDKESSVFLSLCHNAFTSGSFFSREYEKIFTSSLANNKHYQEIIETLSKHKFLSREELATKLKISSGGTLSTLLTDLDKCGFISKYHPYNLNDGTNIIRYAIADNYLHFYFNFIKPILTNIANGDYDDAPQSAIKMDSYAKWLGFAFERWCRRYNRLIAKILGFSGIQYRSGAFFSRTTNKKDPGYQIDLVFDRADNVYTICEIKYLQSPAGIKVISDMEKKLSLFPNKGNKTLHKVLICNEGADSSVLERAYFDQIITCKDLIEAS